MTSIYRPLRALAVCLQWHFILKFEIKTTKQLCSSSYRKNLERGKGREKNKQNSVRKENPQSLHKTRLHTCFFHSIYVPDNVHRLLSIFHGIKARPPSKLLQRSYFWKMLALPYQNPSKPIFSHESPDQTICKPQIQAKYQ